MFRSIYQTKNEEKPNEPRGGGGGDGFGAQRKRITHTHPRT